MTEALLQAFKHLETTIGCFVPSSNTSHHLDVAFIGVEGSRSLGCGRTFSSVALVGSNSLIRIELRLQGKSENRDIIPFASRKRAG
jgi:uncharacterized protein (UPF0212 family)